MKIARNDTPISTPSTEFEYIQPEAKPIFEQFIYFNRNYLILFNVFPLKLKH